MQQYISAIGQDSHRFEETGGLGRSGKPLMLGGVCIPDHEGLAGNSDADVVLHALTNAVSGISCINILGAVTDDMCLNRSVTDSGEYLKAALATLGSDRLVHISISVECLHPKLAGHMEVIRSNIARLTGLPVKAVGITATTGEGLTDFGRGLGIQAICMITVRRDDHE
ncbi:MAG: 2-C-methyl-D-erythritol 2,4-cyclodiphosphate synthase [Saccharofermentanales bacterium]